MQYDFGIITDEGNTFCCTITKHYGSYWSCLEAAALMWEACIAFGDPATRHPTTGETPDEFRARSKDA